MALITLVFSGSSCPLFIGWLGLVSKSCSNISRWWMDCFNDAIVCSYDMTNYEKKAGVIVDSSYGNIDVGLHKLLHSVIQFYITCSA